MLPHRNTHPQSQVNRSPSLMHSVLNNNTGWSATCLRPSPPLRPCLALGSSPHGSPLRCAKLPLHDEDAKILQVIEAYCTSVKPKNANTGWWFVHSCIVLLLVRSYPHYLVFIYGKLVCISILYHLLVKVFFYDSVKKQIILIFEKL